MVKFDKWLTPAHRKLFNSCPVSERLTWVEQLSRTIKSWQFGFGLCVLQSHAEVLVFITNIFLSCSLLSITFLTGHQEEQQQITPLFPNIKLWNLKTDASGNIRKGQTKPGAKMWMLNTVRLQQILTHKPLKSISGKKWTFCYSAWDPDAWHGYFVILLKSFLQKRGQCSWSIICNLKGPQVPGVVIQHDYWNYTVTLIALIAPHLIKHAGFQTQKDKIGDLPPSFLLTPAGCLWWKILLHLRRALPIFFRLWATIRCICRPYEENIWIQAFCLLY